MKKICFSFNHFQFSDGVARSAISIANHLANQKNVSITLRPIFKIEKETLKLLDSRIIIKPVVGFYFNGFSRILNFLPDRILHDWIYGKNDYDIEIGFQHGISTRAVVSSNDKAKHIVWMHGYDVGLVMRKYYLKADQVICVSKFNAIRLKNEINADIKIDFCYNPIDENKVIQLGKEDLNLKKMDCPLFVSVGRLSEEKGYLRLINVAKRLKEEGFKFKVWLIGDGPQGSVLRDTVKNMNLEETVHFFGNQSNPHKFTSRANAFICSSYSEGYSTACTEAIMLGVPVITTEVSGASEIIELAECGSMVENTENGIYLELKDVLLNPLTLDQWKDKLKITKKYFFANERIKKLNKILEI